MVAIKNMAAAVKMHAGSLPDKVYLIDGDRKYTFAQVDALLNKVCAFYVSKGLRRGDLISGVLKNGVEYVVCYLAALRLGCVFNPYPFTLEVKDVTRYLESVGPAIVLCQEQHRQLSECRYPVEVLAEDFLASLDDAEPVADFEPGDESPACIYYSSGTTGNPKSVVFSHKNMIANISSINRGFRFDSDSRHLIILPLGHTASINYSFLPCTLAGGTLVLAESFWKVRNHFWKIIKEQGITYVELVPSVLVALLNTPYDAREYADVAIPWMGCGSATLPKESQIAFMEKYGVKVGNLYGLSETGPTHIDYPLEEGWEPGSAGKALDVNECAIMDEEGKKLGPGETGEIVIKGDNVFIDYYRNHPLYQKVMQDGYFHTGDLGYLKGDILYFAGRKKDLIIKGGVNIAPDEIDEILFKIEEVAEAVTFGIADKYLGEKIVSCVVAKEGKELDEEEVLAFCQEHLSKHKLPDEVLFVDRLPKGPSGKLLRRVMRDQYAEGA